MTYSGNKIVNANNIISVVLIFIFSVVATINANSQNGDWYLYLIIIFFVFIITSGSAFYFEIIDNELIIKNYLLPFINIEYQLSEITQIQLLETNSKSTAKARLKVIRGDQCSISFNAASLGIKEWQLLVNDLSYKKIPIMIEAISLKDEIGIPEE